jgi:signal transduction histidine kinase
MSGRRRFRPSKIRVRLTLLYGAAFFLAGAVLITLLLLYLAHALDGQLTARIGTTGQLHQPGTPELPADVQAQLHARFRQDRDHVLRMMFFASLISLGVVGLLAAGLGWLMAGRALRPLQQITATARRVADRSLHERISLTGTDDEIKDLADTFDAMLERLDRSFDSQRRFVANASHELRTPLTLNRTLIEVTLDDPGVPDAVRQLGTTLLAVNHRQEQLIEGLLTLASSEQTITHGTPVDLADIAGHIVTERRGDAGHAGVDIRADLRPARVTGDPMLLERLIHNLVDNAIRYNVPDHGTVTIATDTIDRRARITVDNTGPAVPAYEVPNLFQPFRRLPAADRRADSTVLSRGAGLGLSIVAAVAHAHDGQVDAEPREDGGLAVQVHLPAAPATTGAGPPGGQAGRPHRQDTARLP